MRTLDTIGLNCPLPVIKAEKALDKMAVGEELLLLASDPLATIDIPNMCNKAGHSYTKLPQTDDVIKIQITKGEK